MPLWTPVLRLSPSRGAGTQLHTFTVQAFREMCTQLAAQSHAPGPRTQPVTSHYLRSGWGRTSGQEVSAGPKGEFKLPFKAEPSNISAELWEGRPTGDVSMRRSWGAAPVWRWRPQAQALPLHPSLSSQACGAALCAPLPLAPRRCLRHREGTATHRQLMCSGEPLREPASSATPDAMQSLCSRRLCLVPSKLGSRAEAFQKT